VYFQLKTVSKSDDVTKRTESDSPQNSALGSWAFGIAIYLAATTAMYGSMLLGPLTTSIPLILLVGLNGLVGQRRYLLASLLLLTTPLTVFFALGASDYVRGTAVLKVGGYSTSFRNVDPELRIPRPQSSSCFYSGHEWVFQKPYNFALQLLTKSFGLMPGAYSGPYPTHDEAIALFSNAPTISMTALQQDKLAVGDDHATLAPGVGQRIIDQCSFRLDATDNTVEARAMILQGECIAVQLSPANSRSLRSGPHEGTICLIRRATGHPFAMYRHFVEVTHRDTRIPADK
jgi:hypothetical protein